VPTTLTCPNPLCRTEFQIGLELSNVTFVNFAQNIVATCPSCGQTFDGAPGDGTYSTIGGRLVKVAEYLAHADRNELLELRARLERLESEGDDRSAVDVLTSIGVEAPHGGWFANQSNRNEIYTVLAIIIMTVGIQFALIGQAALALSQGSSVLARYAAVNPGTVGPNGTVALTAPMKQLLSSSILTNSGGDLTVTIASYSGTTTNTTDTPVQTDRLVIRLSYNAKSKIALPNPFLGIVTFPTTLSASDSQMYE